MPKQTAKTEINLPPHSDSEVHQIITRNGKEYILFVRIDNDDSPENPLEEGRSNGYIYSLGRRHCNFNPDAVEDAVKNNPDHVKLSYFEHGQCRWSVQGDSRPGEEFQWDGVRFAGVWVPDKDALANIDFKGTDPAPEARRKRIIEYAKGVCEEYTQWCNGEVYGYTVALYQLQRDEDGDPIEEREHYQRHIKKGKIGEDSCWGFFGWDYAEGETRDAAESLIADIK